MNKIMSNARYTISRTKEQKTGKKLYVGVLEFGEAQVASLKSDLRVHENFGMKYRYTKLDVTRCNIP